MCVALTGTLHPTGIGHGGNGIIVRPKAQKGRLQPIVYSGVGDCCYMKRPNRDALEQLQIAGFVVNSGRALVMPVTPLSRGHGTHTVAAVWKEHLAELLRSSDHD